VLSGNQLIEGQWVAGDAMFRSAPAKCPAHSFSVGRPGHADAACAAAGSACPTCAAASRAARATFLNRIADHILKDDRLDRRLDQL
jgi:NADP-dependent aldehyde dehydrogenase